MEKNFDLALCLMSALGMITVAVVAVICWRWFSRVQFRWFWAGAGLWAVAVLLKIICALLMNEAVIGFLKEKLPYSPLVLVGGLFVGVQSSVFEIGLTFLAVLVWRRLGRDADRAIAIGTGAGAFEALLLGAASLISMLTALAGVPGTEPVRESIATVAATTPLFWLVGPVERIIAILCHASTRALVLLGVTHRKPVMVLSGFLIFTLLDGVAGAAHVSGMIGKVSTWWIELAVLPFALISIPILRWCYAAWPAQGDHRTGSETSAQQHGEDDAISRAP